MAAVSLIALFLAVLTISAGITGWVSVALRRLQGQPPLAWTPRRAVPWGLVHLLIASLVYLLLAASSLPSADVRGGGKLPMRYALQILAGDSLAKIVVMIATVLLLQRVVGTTRRDWGFTVEAAPDQERLPPPVIGLAAFAMFVPPTFAVHIAIVLLGGWESKHPILEYLKGTGSGLFYVGSFIAAVLVAPVVEEFGFRVMLQGWLEKVMEGTRSWSQLFSGSIAEPPDAPPSDVALVPLSADELSPSEQPELRGLRSVVPIVVSAALFAVAHLSHGPDFIPLFMLSLGLGYIYQRTHSIVPSLIVHFLLNLISMTAIGLQLFFT